MNSPLTARIIGLLTFFLGVILLILVFFAARADLTRPLTGDATGMGFSLLRQIGLLFIMGYAGSTLAGRGVQLYGAAHTKTVTVQETVSEEEVPAPNLPSTTENP